jgi:hypothetical protein
MARDGNAKGILGDACNTCRPHLMGNESKVTGSRREVNPPALRPTRTRGWATALILVQRPRTSVEETLSYHVVLHGNGVIPEADSGKTASRETDAEPSRICPGPRQSRRVGHIPASGNGTRHASRS